MRKRTYNIYVCSLWRSENANDKTGEKHDVNEMFLCGSKSNLTTTHRNLGSCGNDLLGKTAQQDKTLAIIYAFNISTVRKTHCAQDKRKSLK